MTRAPWASDPGGQWKALCAERWVGLPGRCGKLGRKIPARTGAAGTGGGGWQSSSFAGSLRVPLTGHVGA